MSSSSSESSSSPNPSSSLPKFDPFAVHPFTNCSATQNVHNAPAHTKYAYAYSGRSGVPSTPQSQYPANTPSHPQKSPTLSHTPGIFVPFRQDTSSPDLADILKSKSPTKTTVATTSRA